MFFSKNKIDKTLKYYLSNNCYKNYRVLIKYTCLKDSICKKLSSSYKSEILHILESSNIICAKVNSRTIDRLLEYPEIEYICLDEYLFLCGMSVSTANNIHLSNSFSLSGKGIGVGIVDSGVYPHFDLTSPSNRIGYFKDLINNLSYPYDDNGHGTCIAGIIASNGTASKNMYKGIAPHCLLYCYKAFDALGKGFASDILFAIDELINTSKANNIKILCLPFELLTHNIFITEAFDKVFLKAITQGVTPIVPSGSNINIPESIMGIATSNSCLTISGVDSTKSIIPYTYSSSGPYSKSSKPDICAAAVNITSLNCDTSYISEKEGFKLYPSKLEASYKTFSGTSLATAYVSGICALLYESNPNLTFKDISSLLKLSCDTQNFSKHNQGEGLINISKLIL